ncbi:MAG: SDR family oxidoreductase [Boseongicola sp. SB0675_bin_26]|nr:SDR family oxidoreductase [Boseongicola sp. SB0675_bin_26]
MNANDSASGISLAGMRAVVSAGAAGIGRSISETLIGAGARVAVFDVSPDAVAAMKAANPEIVASVADVSDRPGVDAFFERAFDAFGGLDVLVNNAGIAGPTARVEDIDPVEWETTIAINLTGQFYCARKAVPALKASPNGSIVNIASVAGRLGYANRTPYAASKWAIVGFTKSLAIEMGPDGVRVNAILPGIVEGPRMDAVIQARADATGATFDETRDDYMGKISLRRMVSMSDVANLALFLCSPAGRNISGQALSVCGNVESL